jgi:hypothetical protein
MAQITQLAIHRSEFISLSKLLNLTRFFIPVIITSLLVSCSASQHAGVTTITEPSPLEDNVVIWFQYYQDQFDANEGNVVPPTTQYPQSALRGYQQARMDWDGKIRDAKSETALLYIGAGVTALVVTLSIIKIFNHPISVGLH